MRISRDRRLGGTWARGRDSAVWRRDVAQALGQAAGGRVGADQLEFDLRVPGRPAALELAGMPALGRPGVADAQPGVAGGCLGDQVFAALTGLVVLGQSLAPVDCLSIAAIVTADAVSVSTGR